MRYLSKKFVITSPKRNTLRFDSRQSMFVPCRGALDEASSKESNLLSGFILN